MTLREQIRREILKLPGVVEKENRFGTRLSYFFKDREFAHFHSDSQMDILRTPKVDKNDKRIENNPYSEKWILFNFRTEQDAKDALELVKMAYLAISK